MAADATTDDAMDVAPDDVVADDPVAMDVASDDTIDAAMDVPADALMEMTIDSGGGEVACNAVVAQHADEGGTHLEQCSPTLYGTNPPSSGPHYPTWPAYRTYANPVPAGFLVHGLEHGAVVISYNCPGGCAAEVTRAQAFIEALPLDVACAAPKRIILVPDPMLTVRFAAAAWTWTLRADCFDEGIFGAFVADHYDHGPESICTGGADLSATGWCP